MKKFLLVCMALAILTFTACSGGGHWGDNAGGPSVTPPLDEPAQPVANVFSAAVNALNNVQFGYDPDTDGSLKLTKVAAGLRLDVVANDFPAANSVVNINADDFTNDGNYVKATRETPKNLSNERIVSEGLDLRLTGKLTLLDNVWLGGNKLGLQYAEFGLWASDFRFDGTADSVDGTINGAPLNLAESIGAVPLFGGDQNFAQGFTAAQLTTALTFRGGVIAQAYDRTNEDLKVVRGASNLTVDLASTGDPILSELSLNFENFYSFRLAPSFKIEPDGKFSWVPPTANIQATGNNPGITLPEGAGVNLSSSEINVQFFGDKTLAPSEAVGAFNLQVNGTQKGVTGAFGAKR